MIKYSIVLHFTMTSTNQTIRFQEARELIRLASKTPEFWIEPDAFLRYSPVIDWIRKRKSSVPNILEVGSGNYGLNAYVSLPVTKIDLAISKQKRGLQIIGTAEALPFPEGTFDLVCAIDLLEHVPERSRWQIISELIRVSQKEVILAFPFGEAAKLSDMDIARCFRADCGRMLPVLNAHQEHPFPEEKEIRSWIQKMKLMGFKITESRSFGIRLRTCLILNWLRKKQCARFWAERIIKSKILQKLINFGDCYRLILVIQKTSDRSNHSVQSRNIPKHAALL